MHRIRRCDERRDGAASILGVPGPELLTDQLCLLAGRVQVALGDPAARTLVDRGIEEQLESGIRQDDRPDIPPGHDDAAVRHQQPLALQERLPDLRHLGHDGHRSIDGIRPDVARRIRAIQQHARQTAGPVVSQADPRGERHQGGCVIKPCAFSQRERGEGAVQEPCVHEAQPETCGRGRTH